MWLNSNTGCCCCWIKKKKKLLQQLNYKSLVTNLLQVVFVYFHGGGYIIELVVSQVWYIISYIS